MNISVGQRRLIDKTKCQICGKNLTVGFNRPHSLHRTKRKIRPNIQKIQGQIICTQCLRTKTKLSS